jgi:hypothetical protein
MATFLETFEQKLLANLESAYSVGGLTANGIGTFINVTNVAFGSTAIGRFLQLGRNVESTAISFATGYDSANWSGVVNAAAGLIVAVGFIWLAPLTVPAAVVGTAASILAGAAAQALFDTFNEQYPNANLGSAFHDLSSALGDAVSRILDTALDLTEDFAQWLHDLASPLIGNPFDPLVIDLNHNGIELTALGSGASGSQTHFDFAGDGFAERTGWVAPTDGILVHDKNGNGLVDGAGELFGSVNVDGYDVLDLLDSNADGKISAADDRFSELRVWQDLNGNGQVDAGEMRTLAQADVTSISLARTDVTGTNQGHDIGYQSAVSFADDFVIEGQVTYLRTDSNKSTVASLALAANDNRSQFTRKMAS